MRRDSMPASVGAASAGASTTKGEATPPSEGANLRRGHGSTYVPTHPSFRGQGRWVGSCGRCGKHVESAPGQRKHPILGKLCTPCSEGMR